MEDKMARIANSAHGSTPFTKLLGHNPDVLRHWDLLEQTLYATTPFTPELIEQVRRTLAFGNGCEYCMAKGRPNDVQPDLRTSLAVAYAQRVVDDHKGVEDHVFQVLREQFTEADIAQLTALICFFTASQMFGAILDLQPETQEEPAS